jgi:hypothetical protein
MSMGSEGRDFSRDPSSEPDDEMGIARDWSSHWSFSSSFNLEQELIGRTIAPIGQTVANQRGHAL